AIREVESDIVLAARSNVRVLISGEAGGGKGIVGRVSHLGNPLAGTDGVPVPAAGTPGEAVGAGPLRPAGRPDLPPARPPGAGAADSPCRRRGARGPPPRATAFLNDIGETRRGIQTRLRHFFETGEVRPLGAEEPLPPLDVRVIASPQDSLVDRIADGRFDA